MARILSIQVGRPKRYGTPYAPDPFSRTWRSAIFKNPVLGEIWLGEESLTGDAVEDHRFHGGPDNAVLCYAAAHYPQWQHEWHSAEPLPYGGFGENFTVEGLDEHSVCVGDTYAIGDVRIQVTGPRLPCYKLERRWKRAGLIKEVLDTNRGGWYVRVLKTGFVNAGEEMALVERPRPRWTITRVNEVSFDRSNREACLDLASVPELAERWRAWLLGKIQSGVRTRS